MLKYLFIVISSIPFNLWFCLNIVGSLQDAKFAIVLEEDLDISIDFFRYYTSTSLKTNILKCNIWHGFIVRSEVLS